MNGIEAISAIDAASAGAELAPLAPRTEIALRNDTVRAAQSFGDLVSDGVGNVEAKIENANRMVRAFALDDSVPLHEVTIALEEARLAVELTSQIRARIVESYREIMNMQL